MRGFILLQRLAIFAAALPATYVAARAADDLETRTTNVRFTENDIIARIGSQVILAGELLPTVEETLEQRPKDSLAPEELESLRLAEIRRLLPGLIETKLVYLDAKARIPQETWVKIIPQLDKQFDTSHVPKLIETYNVSNRGELEKVLRARGDSIGARRQTFLERNIAAQWINQNTKGKDGRAREAYVKRIRDRTIIWTIFDAAETEARN